MQHGLGPAEMSRWLRWATQGPGSEDLEQPAGELCVLAHMMYELEELDADDGAVKKPTRQPADWDAFDHAGLERVIGGECAFVQEALQLREDDGKESSNSAPPAGPAWPARFEKPYADVLYVYDEDDE